MAKRQLNQKHWERSLALRFLRKSCFYPFWMRLKKLDWRLTGGYFSFVEISNVIYFKSNWVFVKDNATILLQASRNNYSFSIIKRNEIVYAAVCPTHLEEPFLKELKQTGKFLFIPRLGSQSAEVRKWQSKWLQHFKQNGKWSKKIEKLGILPVYMPEALVKPRARGK